MSAVPLIRAGIVGCGKRGVICLAGQMARSFSETGFVVAALCDRNLERLVSATRMLAREYAAHGVVCAPRHYLDFRQLVADPAVDVVIVTTPQYVHLEPTLAALAARKTLYLDKPIAHDLSDALAIVRAAHRAGRPVLMGFTRRYEAVWNRAHALLREGAIGDLAMMLLRAVIPYHVYFHGFHRRREFSGDALNDKASHHFDVFNWFAGGPAQSLSGFGGLRVFRPDPAAPRRCGECQRDCPYRRATGGGQDALVAFLGDTSWDRETDPEFMDDLCVYAPGADILDHATIQVRYENGIAASLFYCLFGPHAPDEETFELVGTKGRLIISRHRGTIDLIGDHGRRRETIDARDEHFGTTHFGADLQLVRRLRQFHEGSPPNVGVDEGLAATRMVVAALRSIDGGGQLVNLSDLPAPPPAPTALVDATP